MKNYLPLLLLLINYYAFSQNIKGYISNNQGEVQPNVIVYVKKNDSILHKKTTDAQGYFTFKLNIGTYNLLIESSEFLPKSINVNIESEQDYDLGTIELDYKSKSLDELKLTAYNKLKRLKKNPISVSVIDIKDVERKSLNSADLMATISGVNIRQSGGLGSDTEISVNGMTGKQIRFFIDGIPLDAYNEELNIGAIPLNFLSRVEVYKGSVPIDLASDALGGAVNFISTESNKTLINLNYTVGSFNTHKLGANVFYKSTNNIFLKLNSYANLSDNNYKMNDVEIIHKDGSVTIDDAKRFHNQFRNYFIEGQLGVINKNWADKAFISIYQMASKYELQHNTLATQVYGEAFTKNKTTGILAKYSKKNIIKDIDIDMFGIFRTSNPRFTDISPYIYNWKGYIIGEKQNSIGELTTLGKSLDLTDTNLTAQANILWNISSQIKLKSTIQRGYFRRKGLDYISQKQQVEDANLLPKIHHKTIGALATEINFFENKFKSISSIKYYNYHSKGQERIKSTFTDITNEKTGIGYGQAFSYEPNKNYLVKISYENALRIPSTYEIFGDLALLLPNYSLKPEHSHNINIGGQYDGKKIKAEANLFYRKTKDIIWLRPSTLYAQYQNIFDTQTTGIDTEISYQFLNDFKVNINATWQNIINKGSVEHSTKYINSRLPNIPYLFGNVNFNYSKKHILGMPINSKIWYGIRYVEQFYLFWEQDGRKDLKNIIPRQYPNFCGLSLSDELEKYSLTLEIQNIFNQKIYDNFKLQKPGRAFYITFNYNFKK